MVLHFCMHDSVLHARSVSPCPLSRTPSQVGDRVEGSLGNNLEQFGTMQGALHDIVQQGEGEEGSGGGDEERKARRGAG